MTFLSLSPEFLPNLITGLRYAGVVGLSLAWGLHHRQVGLSVYRVREWRQAYVQICALGSEMRYLTLALGALVCGLVWMGAVALLMGPFTSMLAWTLSLVIYSLTSFSLLQNADDTFWTQFEKERK